MVLKPHSIAWYDRLATVQQGYFYPWRSYLGMGSGEEAYLPLVRQHLGPTVDVLDVACGHGRDTIAVAGECRSILGYDRIAPWIERARRAAAEAGLTNVDFRCHDSSPEANGGRARLPGVAAAYDLLICSKGPFHWIDDARRVARPGAVLLMLVPDATPHTPWHGDLPAQLRWKPKPVDEWARPAIESRLEMVELSLHSWWCFDVPEWFPDVESLYDWLTWGHSAAEVPTFDAVAGMLERIFDQHAGAKGVEIRQRRYLWKAIVPD